MEYSNILYEVVDGIAKITINRPKAMNALNASTVKELAHAFANAKENDSVRVVILTGSGEKAFIAGADINEIKTNLEKGPMAAREEFALKGQRFVTTIENLGKPVIAAVNGYVIRLKTSMTQKVQDIDDLKDLNVQDIDDPIQNICNLILSIK